MSLGSRLDSLDNPFTRTILKRVIGARRSKSLRREIILNHVDGEWLYVVDEKVLSPTYHHWVDPAKWDKRADDVFFWHYVPQPGDVIVDIGAGIGTELFAYSARVGPTGLVFAVEAHPRTFEALQRLVGLNSGKGLRCPVVTDCLAMSDHQGLVQISDSETHIGNSLVESGGIQTIATTLDAFRAEKSLDRINFLKMNIEGAEREALRRADDLLAITRNGAISCHDFVYERTGNAYFRTKEEVRVILSDAGFDIIERPDAKDPWTRDYLYISRPETDDVTVAGMRIQENVE